jgi:hypothetical protein
LTTRDRSQIWRRGRNCIEFATRSHACRCEEEGPLREQRAYSLSGSTTGSGLDHVV